MTAAKVLMVTAALTIAATVAGVSQSRTGGVRAAALVNRGITHVPGIRVGQFTLAERPTGCTVVLVDGEGAVGGVSQRGGAPGTRETDLLDPLNMVDKVNAIVLVGRQRLRPRRRAGRREVPRRAARSAGTWARPAWCRSCPPPSCSTSGSAAIRRSGPTADCGYKAATRRIRTAPWRKATSAPAPAPPSASSAARGAR